ncbi:hypothetical protein HJFPF1_04191 [Paramyrothecium foliicola]|nr:hypothetical protein HJFPF1_04191 [Paramyrothecium foliicola]
MAQPLLVETWCLYAFGSLIILARILARWRTIGVKQFRPDDYLIFLSWGTYTMMTVAAHIVGGRGDLHALPMADREAMTKEEAKPFIYGTQWFCAGVATYILFIWSLKLNMLFLYQRVVRGLWVEKFIKPVMGLVIVTFFATYLILFCACRPYSRMWVVFPDQGALCQPQSVLNMVPPLVFNLVTDVCIILIPAPVVIPVRTTVWRRIGLLCLFGAADETIPVMIAAILRVTMVLVAKDGPTAAIWSCREDFVAIVVGQAILIRPLFTKKFWTGQLTGPTSGFSSGPSRDSQKFDGSRDLRNSKRGNKAKTKDPFSLTAALATVNEDGDQRHIGSTDNIIHGSEPSSDIPLDNLQELSAFGELEDGNRRPTIRIKVSKQVRVESDDQSPEVIYQVHDGVSARSNTLCWIGDSRGYHGECR